MSEKMTYSKQARKLAREELQRQESSFAYKYGEASEEELLKYLWHSARQLGFTPWDNDIVGVAVLKRRLGAWPLVLKKAGLKFTPAQERADTPNLFVREAQQQEIYHQRALAAMQNHDRDFRQQHGGDSDEDILEYLRGWAVRLKHTPNQCEVQGGGYIRERFGGWDKAVKRAGLPEPPNNPPKLFNRLVYLDELKRQRRLAREEQQIAAENEKVIYVAPTLG